MKEENIEDMTNEWLLEKAMITCVCLGSKRKLSKALLKEQHTQLYQARQEILKRMGSNLNN